MFNPSGPSPFVKPVTPEIIAQWGTAPARVKVGFNMNDFLLFDIVKNDFVMNAFIWFKFDPKEVSAETIDKFAFTKGDILKKSDARITTANGITTVFYTIRVAFSSIVDYTRFPIDDHTLFLNLTNPAVTAEQLIYDVDHEGYVVAESLYLTGWNVVGHETKSSGFSTINLGDNQTITQPKTVFSIDVSKQDLRQLALIFLPLLFLFYVGLLTFAIRDAAVAMTFPLASISGLFAYSFVIQTLAPAVGYFMISDYLFLFFLISSFIIFLVGSLTVIPEHIIAKKRVAQIEGMTVLILHLTLIGLWYYLTNIHGIS
jgi:hypothetical protein